MVIDNMTLKERERIGDNRTSSCSFAHSQTESSNRTFDRLKSKSCCCVKAEC